MYMKMGLIDSGIGGLTILKTLLKKYPNHEYVYFGDTLHIPYGEKTKEEIIKYSNSIINFLNKEKVELIILACGTLSSNKEYLDNKDKTLDIISPLKNKLDNYNNIGIMATPLSVKINAFKNVIKTNYNLIACPKLVPIIESNNYKNIDEIIKDYLKDALKSDALILGCTHYAIIKDYIKKYYHGKIFTLDEFVDLGNLKESKKDLKIYFSLINDQIIENTKKILGINNIKIERKCLDD